MATLISAERLVKLYQMGEETVRALDGVSFNIPVGEYCAIVGPSGSGKSTLMNIIEEITGPCNVAQLKTGRLNHPFELASFIGKTLLTGKDVTPEFLRAEGAETIKALTGGDRLDAELKGKNERIQIVDHYNIAITCNTDLTLRLQGDVEAWKRRLLVIDFSNPPPAKRQHDFAKILLKEEGEGILKWMVQGALLLQQDLNKAGDYVLSDNQQEGIDRILEQSESVEIFVKECIYTFAGEDVTYNEVRTAYHDYCDSKGWISTSSNEFNRLFKNAVLKHYKQTPRQDINRCGKDQRGFKNIAINKEVMKNA